MKNIITTTSILVLIILIIIIVTLLYYYKNYDEKSLKNIPNQSIINIIDNQEDKKIIDNPNILNNGDKISLISYKSNKYCADDPRGLQCNRNIKDIWSEFKILKNDNSKIMDGDIIYLQGSRNNNYCTFDNIIMCNNNNVSLWEKYIIYKVIKEEDNYIKNDNIIALSSLKNNKYCSDTVSYRTQDKIINCGSNVLDESEKFIIKKII